MQPMFVVGTTSKDPKHAEARKRRRHAEKTRAETDPALAEKLKAQSVAGAGRARKSEARYSERFAKEREELLLQQQNERPSAMLAPDVDGLITEAEACHAGPDAAAFLQSVWNERALDDLGEKSRSIELSLYDDDDEPSGGEVRVESRVPMRPNAEPDTPHGYPLLLRVTPNLPQHRWHGCCACLACSCGAGTALAAHAPRSGRFHLLHPGAAGSSCATRGSYTQLTRWVCCGTTARACPSART